MSKKFKPLCVTDCATLYNGDCISVMNFLQIYEMYKNDICVSKVENYINPPKCCFVIELPIIDIDKYGMDYIIHILRQKNINEDEIMRVLFQLRENNLFRKYWEGWH